MRRKESVMKLQDTGLTAQDIKDKVNKYMIETYERFDFLAETAKDMYLYDENMTFMQVLPLTMQAAVMKRL